MQTRTLLFAIAGILSATANSHAQVKVISAYYGRQSPEKSIDVKELMQKKFDLGLYQFRLEPSVLGVNPNPKRQNALIVQYSYGGQKAFAQAKDGEVFALPGLGAPRPSAGTPLRFQNGSARVTYVYELNRWGAWQWKAQLDPGSVYAARGQAGDNWIVTDRNGRVLRQVRVSAGMAPIYLR